MKSINLKKEVSGSLESVLDQLTDALKSQGFGILTRIDFHTKIKEKLGKDLPPTVILGACNPQLAYDAFMSNSDVASLLPCNAVIREIGKNQMSVELARPTALMNILGDEKLVRLSKDADLRLQNVLDNMGN